MFHASVGGYARLRDFSVENMKFGYDYMLFVSIKYFSWILRVAKAQLQVKHSMFFVFNYNFCQLKHMIIVINVHSTSPFSCGSLMKFMNIPLKIITLDIWRKRLTDCHKTRGTLINQLLKSTSIIYFKFLEYHNWTRHGKRFIDCLNNLCNGPCVTWRSDEGGRVVPSKAEDFLVSAPHTTPINLSKNMYRPVI